ncbi:MAG: RNB domain-containing ribonuclease [Gammaproteobacteria bacterium]|nr:RNB domain-containing ribonuclease [Gammaproteobacteria bacterium]MCP5135759.1 RNB domain-containing ribonuclease [Gammaproteobacteria bacterium]
MLSEMSFRLDALVIYKRRPARIIGLGEKLEIQTLDGKNKRVRDKDVTLLHPGPARQLPTAERAEIGEESVREAWELLDGEATTLTDLAELLFGQADPSDLWHVWLLRDDGLWFEGDGDAVRPRGREAIEADRAERARKADEAAAWEALLERLRKGEILDGDRKPLAEVERLALNAQTSSRILKALDQSETPESAHQTLLRVGYWPESFNPWPQRFDLILGEPDIAVPMLPEEERLDLTHLESWAIDDAGNQDPDDAIAVDGDMLWVHVADVAALVPADSALDLAARERGANLYLPETTWQMLPSAITERLGLGLAEISPALSFGMRVRESGDIEDIRIAPSWVKVKRVSYEEADAILDAPPLAAINALTQRGYDKRMARSAATIRLPEVRVRVTDGIVELRPLPALRSRTMVTNAMLLAGEAAARYADANTIPFPYSTQAAPDNVETPETPSQMWAYRKKFKRTQMQTSPEPHSGLGLEMYAQATSPLRRYLDLVVHQQLRAHLRGEPVLDHDAIVERIGRADVLIGAVRKAERQSNRHWTLVWLQQHPEWEGEAVVVDRRERRGTVLIPELGLDTMMSLAPQLTPDETLTLRYKGANFPDLSVTFATQ